MSNWVWGIGVFILAMILITMVLLKKARQLVDREFYIPPEDRENWPTTHPPKDEWL